MSELNENPIHVAAVDIGSNAARLLIKRVDKTDDNALNLSKALFVRVPLRLGEDVFKKGEISKSKQEYIVNMIKGFKHLMELYDVQAFRMCATSALRDAKNGKRVIKKVHKKAGMDIEIISGKEEAEIIYDNHVESFAGPGNYLYVDVGGGSTEITFISDKKMLFSKSFNIGTLRMLSGSVADDVLPAIEQEIANITTGYPDVKLIGSGGNINKLYRIANAREKRVGVLPVATLQRLYNQLSKLSVEERMARYNFKPDRADVIVPAAEIFLHVSKCANATEIMVPVFGLADGIIRLLANKLMASIDKAQDPEMEQTIEKIEKTEKLKEKLKKKDTK